MHNRLAPFAVLALAIVALSWIDPIYIPMLLLGPIVTGVVAGRRGAARPVAAAWVAAGLINLVLDWAINNEDQLFHLVVAAWTGLVALGVGLLVARAPGAPRLPRPWSSSPGSPAS